MENQPEIPAHLLVAHKTLTEIIQRGSHEHTIPCFLFVNNILKESLTEYAKQELSSLYDKVAKTLPSEHLYQEIIPYHYFLISQLLFNEEHQSRFFGTRKNLTEVRPGDVMVYIDPDYEPDMNKRKPGKSSGTHIAFVDDIINLKELENSLTLRLIDSSQRLSGRGINPDFYKTDLHSKI